MWKYWEDISKFCIKMFKIKYEIYIRHTEIRYFPTIHTFITEHLILNFHIIVLLLWLNYILPNGTALSIVDHPVLVQKSHIQKCQKTPRKISLVKHIQSNFIFQYACKCSIHEIQPFQYKSSCDICNILKIIMRK